MDSETIGRMQLLAIVLAFLGWVLVSIHQDVKTQRLLDKAQEELVTARDRYDAGMEALEKSATAREKADAILREKSKILENALDMAAEWDSIAIPDSVREAIQAGASLCAPGHASGRSENSFQSGGKDSGRSSPAAP